MRSTDDKIILGIETSCDDTSIAIIRGNPNNSEQTPEILAHLSASQDEVFSKWQGVVPEIASRNHLATITPLISKAFFEAGISSVDQIDLIGVTTMPGLLGPLLVGINSAKTLALFGEKAILPVNHIHAHIEAIHLTKTVKYPYLGVIVSGGHTQFILVYASDIFEVLGGTLDDAAGEAFDKGAKILGLGYPGGRLIDQMSKGSDQHRFDFPVGMKHSKDCNLSFSGVKTSLRQFIERNPHYTENSNDLKDICGSYQYAIISAINLKLEYAIKKAKENLGISSLNIVIGGGVAANSKLREILMAHYGNIHFVSPEYCTDNGAMIANFALRNFNKAISFPNCLNIDAKGRIPSAKSNSLQHDAI